MHINTISFQTSVSLLPNDQIRFETMKAERPRYASQQRDFVCNIHSVCDVGISSVHSGASNWNERIFDVPAHGPLRASSQTFNLRRCEYLHEPIVNLSRPAPASRRRRTFRLLSQRTTVMTFRSDYFSSHWYITKLHQICRSVYRKVEKTGRRFADKIAIDQNWNKRRSNQLQWDLQTVTCNH